jgi:hypothetical protein
MPEFYTVTMKRKHIVRKYDAAGVATETESFIEERYTGLPYQTCENYRKKFPEACVEITRDYSGVQATSINHGSGFSQTRKQHPAKKFVTDDRPKPTKPATGFMSDGFAGVVNRMMEREAH